MLQVLQANRATLDTAKRVMRYLKDTIKCSFKACVGFSNADWAGDVNDHRSTLMMMNIRAYVSYGIVIARKE